MNSRESCGFALTGTDPPRHGKGRQERERAGALRAGTGQRPPLALHRPGPTPAPAPRCRRASGLPPPPVPGCGASPPPHGAAPGGGRTPLWLPVGLEVRGWRRRDGCPEETRCPTLSFLSGRQQHPSGSSIPAAAAAASRRRAPCALPARCLRRPPRGARLRTGAVATPAAGGGNPGRGERGHLRARFWGVSRRFSARCRRRSGPERVGLFLRLITGGVFNPPSVPADGDAGAPLLQLSRPGTRVGNAGLRGTPLSPAVTARGI